VAIGKLINAADRVEMDKVAQEQRRARRRRCE
jgi:hypothetical protein